MSRGFDGLLRKAIKGEGLYVNAANGDGKCWLSNGHWAIKARQSDLPGALRQGEGKYTGKTLDRAEPMLEYKCPDLTKIVPHEKGPELTFTSHVTGSGRLLMLTDERIARELYLMDGWPTSGLDRAYVDPIVEHAGEGPTWHAGEDENHAASLWDGDECVAVLMPVACKSHI